MSIKSSFAADAWARYDNPSKMGLGIELQDERGGRIDSVADPRNLLGPLLPAPDDRILILLSAIDPYGDTVFNRIQMERFLSEWTSIASSCKTQEEKELVSKIASMALRCRDEVHLYLKFIGD